MPCDTERGCPYPLSPGGAGALYPDNRLAVDVWQRWRLLGPVVLDFLPVECTALEAEFLMEQLYTLESHLRELQNEEP